MWLFFPKPKVVRDQRKFGKYWAFCSKEKFFAPGWIRIRIWWSSVYKAVVIADVFLGNTGLFVVKKNFLHLVGFESGFGGLPVIKQSL